MNIEENTSPEEDSAVQGEAQVIAPESPSEVEVQLDENPENPHEEVVPVGLEEAAKVAPVELEEAAKADPVELEEAAKADPVELEEAAKADPVESEEAAKAAPVDNEEPKAEKPLTPEEELQKYVDLMATSLAQSGSPDFKTFWDARKRCLELFKGKISPAVRAVHWVKYRELTKEARRLKDIFEEQTAFAVEQIDMAITALEKDLTELDQQLEKIADPEFPKTCRTLRENYVKYCQIQRELILLNAQASRINGLRKELIKTEIRIRQKNKFFQRLSATGDGVFPRRKELIKEISQLFAQDVNSFVSENFSRGDLGKPIHAFREEIKDLQNVAKLLTLNTKAFAQTRKQLSECWDKLKVEDKERRKVHAQQKEDYKKNALTVQTKIDELKASIESGVLSISEAQHQLDEISKFMKTVELGREEVSSLRGELSQAQKPLREKLKEEEKKRREQILKKEQARQKKIKVLEEKIEALSDTLDTLDLNTLKAGFEEARQEMKLLGLSGFEKESLQRLFIPIRDALAEKEEEELLNIPDDQKAALKQLKEVLRNKQQRRTEIKEQIEKYRKASGSSGLDFEQSMYFNEQLTVEKSRLEKINQGVEEVESKIFALGKPGTK